MKWFGYLLLPVVITLLLCSLCLSAGAAGSAGQVEAVLQTKDGQELTVRMQTYNEQQYLLLPSFADLKHLQINGVNGTITRKDRFIDCTNTKPVNLLELIPTFVSGKAYEVIFKNSAGKKTNVQIMKSDSLPTVFVQLGTNQAGEPVDRQWMNSSKNNRVVNSTLFKVSPEGKLIVKTGMESIRCRGRASFTRAIRKSYTLKLDTRFALVDKAEADKKWVMVANDVRDKRLYHDRTGICNLSARWLYQTLHGKYALDVEFADLYIDGEYCGLYMLSEKPEISDTRISITKGKMKEEDSSSVTRVVGTCGLYLNGKTVWEGYDTDSHKDRMDTACKQVTTVIYSSEEEDKEDPAISAGIRAYQYATASVPGKDGGYILEMDLDFYPVRSWFVTRMGATIALKEPEYASREQVQRIAVYVQQFEDALCSLSGFNASGRHFTEYADLDSAVLTHAVDFFLVNIDAFYSSGYMIVDCIDGELQPITFGPVWDNDYCELADITSDSLYSSRRAFLLKTKQSGYPNTPWLEQWLAKTEYVSRMYKLWQEEFSPAVETLTKKIIPAFISKVEPALGMTEAVTEKFGSKYYLQKVAKGIDSRTITWKRLWSSVRLKGITISRSGNHLTVSPDGSFKKVTWYRVSEKDYTCKAVFKSESTTYTPKQSGLYFAEVSGPNLGGQAVSIKLCSEVIRFDVKEKKK